MDNKNAAGELVLDTEGNPMEIGGHYATRGGDDKIYLGQDLENRDNMVFRSPNGFQTWRRNFKINEYKKRSHAILEYRPGGKDVYLSYDDAKGGRRRRKTKRRKTKRRKTMRRRR